MKKLIFIIGLISLLSCNREVDIQVVPPISVFPNPFANVASIYVSNEINSNVDYQVKVCRGDQTLFEINNVNIGQQIQINMEEHDPGTYTVKLYTPNGIYSTTMIKAQ